ncbi:MAG: LUD domain-containing protein [Thermaceae bacterium]|nr:LUD domain-containing protein [Thermaceae bacterium]
MREYILERIHRALEHRPGSELPPPLALPTLSPEEALKLFQERLNANGGETVHLDNLGAARAWLLDFARSFAGVALGLELPESLHPDLPILPPQEAPLGISWALGAVAETGTVIVSSQDGRRTQLLPPTHLVFIPQERVYGTLLEALAALQSALPSAVGLHSGPSKSADIGQIMVKGVHGPGRLIAAVVAEPQD